MFICTLPAYFNLEHAPVQVGPAVRAAHWVPLGSASMFTLGALCPHAKSWINGQFDTWKGEESGQSASSRRRGFLEQNEKRERLREFYLRTLQIIARERFITFATGLLAHVA